MIELTPIKWREKDIKELERTVKNFNSKIRRVSSKAPETAAYQPEKASVKDLKSKITNRKDYNKLIKQMQRYSVKGAETVKTNPQGVTLTKYSIKELGIQARAVTAKRKAKAKEYNVDMPDMGKMGMIKQYEFRPKEFDFSKITPEKLKPLQKLLSKEFLSDFEAQGYQRYKDNYVKGAYENLGFYAEPVVEIVLPLDAVRFFKISQKDPMLEISFQYDPLEQEVKATQIVNRLNYYIAKGEL